MRSYVPWICAGCMLFGIIGLGAKKAFLHTRADPENTSPAKKQTLLLLPYKIIGNYVIEKPGEGSEAVTQ